MRICPVYGWYYLLLFYNFARNPMSPICQQANFACIYQLISAIPLNLLINVINTNVYDTSVIIMLNIYMVYHDNSNCNYN